MEDKYIVVKVFQGDKPAKLPKGSLRELGKIISRSLLRRMKNEYVRCPVRNEAIPFLLCFNCKNFIRRVKGEVHCRGDKI
ncbi:MAG: hypothetical protein B6U69_00050 [Thermofilum sp. ex4484_15]|nr:MAG: hypothetical protein B6U69_00050 [Thermofilum sp. ex4484_15]